VDLTPGSYIAGETAGTGTVLSDYVTNISGDCAANGSVTLALGESKTCTITNTKKGMVEVLKITNGQPRPDLDIRFTLYLDGGSPGDLVANDVALETLSTLGDVDGLLQFT
jgi:hypothetical protein